MGDEAPQFVCAKCGKRFRWTASLAGRRPRRPCGAVFEYPTDPPGAAAQYDVAPTPAAPIPASAAALAPLAYRAPKDDVPEKSDTETIKDLYMPLWLLAGGVVIDVVAAFFQQRGTIESALTQVGVQLILGTTIML